MNETSKQLPAVEKKKSYEGRHKPFVNRIHCPVRYYENQDWFVDELVRVELTPKEALKLSVMFD